MRTYQGRNRAKGKSIVGLAMNAFRRNQGATSLLDMTDAGLFIVSDEASSKRVVAKNANHAERRDAGVICETMAG